MAHERARELWRTFVADILHDVPLHEREAHIAAAAFWLGMVTAEFTVMSTDLKRELESAAAASLACHHVKDT